MRDYQDFESSLTLKGNLIIKGRVNEIKIPDKLILLNQSNEINGKFGHFKRSKYAKKWPNLNIFYALGKVVFEKLESNSTSSTSLRLSGMKLTNLNQNIVTYRKLFDQKKLKTQNVQDYIDFIHVS